MVDIEECEEFGKAVGIRLLNERSLKDMYWEIGSGEEWSLSELRSGDMEWDLTDYCADEMEDTESFDSLLDEHDPRDIECYTDAVVGCTNVLKDAFIKSDLNFLRP